MKIKFDINLMKFISFFETLTRVHVKDLIQEEGQLIFIVKQGEIGKAIGKNGVNVRRLEKSLNRKIKIVEFNTELLQFIKNIVYPAKIEEIDEKDGIVTITALDSKSRGLLIGRGAQNLRGFEKIVRRYHKIEEMKVN